MTKRKAPTTDRLRKDIDRGKAGDKVGYPDPSAAPLGTDDEAAGNPPTEAERERASREEMRRPDAHRASRGRPNSGEE